MQMVFKMDMPMCRNAVPIFANRISLFVEEDDIKSNHKNTAARAYCLL